MATVDGSERQKPTDDSQSHSSNSYHPLVQNQIWKEFGEPSSSYLHPLIINLKYSDETKIKLTEAVWTVSDPASPSYGKYLSTQEMAQLYGASKRTIQTVIDHLVQLKAHNIKVSPTRDSISCLVGVKELNESFGVQLKIFASREGRKIVRSALPYTLPHHLTDHIDIILGIYNFPVPRKSIWTPNGINPSKDQTKPNPSSLHSIQKKTKTNTHTSNISPIASTKSDSRPVVYQAYGAYPNNILVSYSLFCPSGDYMAPDGSCPSVNNSTLSVVGVNIFSVPTVSFSKTVTLNVAFSDIICVNDPVTKLFGCQTALPQETYYVPYRIYVQTIFSDGSLSPKGNYPYPAICTPYVTPQMVYDLYGLPSHPSVSGRNSNKINNAVVEFELQYYSSEDLIQFGEAFGLPHSSTLDEYVNLIGYNDETNPGYESSLDLQWIMAMAPGVKTTFWSINSTGQDASLQVDDILAWTIAMNSLEHPFQVNSISYGQPESTVDAYLGAGYLARSDIEFAKLALRGVTIIIASGDTGSSDSDIFDSITCSQTNPDWPSQSPFVLSIGATYITPYSNPICYNDSPLGGIDCSTNPLSEIVTGINYGIFFTSGGGFSNVTSRPRYQEEAVEEYLAHYPQAQPSDNSLWNRRGRAYPDLAAVGHNILITVSNSMLPIDGTSCSAPIIAGIFTLLNDIRKEYHLPLLGFANPLLYAIAKEYPDSFNDVTLGSTNCTALSGTSSFVPAECCSSGFQASSGWDAASGLGSPNYAVLKDSIIDILFRLNPNRHPRPHRPSHHHHHHHHHGHDHGNSGKDDNDDRYGSVGEEDMTDNFVDTWDDNTSNNTSLNTSMIVLIVIGSIVMVLLMVVIGLLLKNKKWVKNKIELLPPNIPLASSKARASASNNKDGYEALSSHRIPLNC